MALWGCGVGAAAAITSTHAPHGATLAPPGSGLRSGAASACPTLLLLSGFRLPARASGCASPGRSRAPAPARPRAAYMSCGGSSIVRSTPGAVAAALSFLVCPRSSPTTCVCRPHSGQSTLSSSGPESNHMRQLSAAPSPRTSHLEQVNGRPAILQYDGDDELARYGVQLSERGFKPGQSEHLRWVPSGGLGQPECRRRPGAAGCSNRTRRSYSRIRGFFWVRFPWLGFACTGSSGACH